MLIKSFENPNLAARYTRLFLHKRLWLFRSSTARTEYGSVDAVEVTAARYPGAAWSTRSWRPLGPRRSEDDESGVARDEIAFAEQAFTDY